MTTTLVCPCGLPSSQRSYDYPAIWWAPERGATRMSCAYVSTLVTTAQLRLHTWPMQLQGTCKVRRHISAAPPAVLCLLILRPKMAASHRRRGQPTRRVYNCPRVDPSSWSTAPRAVMLDLSPTHRAKSGAWVQDPSLCAPPSPTVGRPTTHESVDAFCADDKVCHHTRRGTYNGNTGQCLQRTLITTSIASIPTDVSTCLDNDHPGSVPVHSVRSGRSHSTIALVDEFLFSVHSPCCFDHGALHHNPSVVPCEGQPLDVDPKLTPCLQRYVADSL